MIAEWRRCVDCDRQFGLTRRQCHAGLFAQRDRCGVCRPARIRTLAAARARSFRLRRRNAELALIHAATSPEAA